MIRTQKSERFFAFFPGLNIDFHGLKKEKHHNFTFTFSDIASIHPSLFSSNFLQLSLQLSLPPNYFNHHMRHLHFVRKRVLRQMSCVNRNNRVMKKKQARFHHTDIN